MARTDKPPRGYKPSMVFTSKCLRCGHTVSALGWYEFEKACDRHRARCPKREKP